MKTLSRNIDQRLQKIIAREKAAKQARETEEAHRLAQQTERQNAEARAQSDWVAVRSQFEKLVADLNGQLQETSMSLELGTSRVSATANRLEDLEVTLKRDGVLAKAQRLAVKIERDGLVRTTIMVNPQPEAEQAPFYIKDPQCTEKFRDVILTYLEAATGV